MRLWQKMCICSLSFFLLAFWIAGILMIENNKNTAFEQALRQSADEQTGISSGILRYVMLNRAKESRIEGARDKDYITEYLDSRINSRGIYLEIRDEDQIMYSNLDETLPAAGAGSEGGSGVAEYRIQESGSRQYLILTNQIPLRNRNLTNTYIRDISGIYSDRKNQYSYFLKLCAVISVIMAGGMYFMIRHLTKTLRVLTESVKKFGKGNHKERVRIHARDEVAELAGSYNEMADAVERRILELENKAKEQQRFLDNFTHELRTPLTSVIGYADLLRSAPGGEEQTQELADRIFREGKRIEKLSRFMMDLVFLERHSFELIPCDLRTIMMEAAGRFEAAAFETELKCTMPDSDAVILGERELLLILISNLLDNAQKASEHGGSIYLRSHTGESSVILEVEDEGKGIPEEDKARVFERFYMADKVRNRKNSGIGLGLSICADIVKITKAGSDLASNEGKDTLVNIIYPCYQQEEN